MAVYGFQFKDGPSVSFAEIVYVGKEKRSGKYDYNGLRRSNNGQCIFQHTIAGRGRIRIDGRTWEVEPGSAFLVKTGTDHRYYLPDDSPLWEFQFITLVGKEAEECWGFVQEQMGPIIRIANDSPVIRTLKQIYGDADAREITNGYKAAGLAAQFVMDLYQTIKYKPIFPEQWPSSVVKAMRMIEEECDQISSIEELSESLGLTPYKLSRIFHRSTGMTVVQYLTKIRMDKAMELLRRTQLPIQEIAVRTGFSSDNYFIKVFHKLTGMTPRQFRFGKNIAQEVDHISFD